VQERSRSESEEGSSVEVVRFPVNNSESRRVGGLDTRVEALRIRRLTAQRLGLRAQQLGLRTGSLAMSDGRVQSEHADLVLDALPLPSRAVDNVCRRQNRVLVRCPFQVSGFRVRGWASRVGDFGECTQSRG
jgi:hypothetical protein